MVRMPRAELGAREAQAAVCLCIRGHALGPPAPASPSASPIAGSPPHAGSPILAAGRRPVCARQANRGGWAGAVTPPRCCHELSPGEQPNLGTAGSCPRSWFGLWGLHRPTRPGRFSAAAFQAQAQCIGSDSGWGALAVSLRAAFRGGVWGWAAGGLPMARSPLDPCCPCPAVVPGQHSGHAVAWR